MILSLERLRLEVRRSRTLTLTSLLFLGLLSFLILSLVVIFLRLEEVAASARRIEQSIEAVRVLNRIESGMSGMETALYSRLHAADASPRADFEAADKDVRSSLAALAETQRSDPNRARQFARLEADVGTRRSTLSERFEALDRALPGLRAEDAAAWMRDVRTSPVRDRLEEVKSQLSTSISSEQGELDGDVATLRITFLGSSVVGVFFCIVCFMAFRSYFASQAESSWLQSHEAAFSLRMQSVRSLKAFADDFMRFFEETFGTLRGAFYLRGHGSGELRLLAGRGFPQGDNTGPSGPGSGAGQGSSAASKPPTDLAMSALSRVEPFVVAGETGGRLTMTTSFGDLPLASIAVVPLVYDNDVLGVAEVHLASDVDATELSFLKRLSSTAGTALKTLMDRVALEERNTELRDARDKLEERAFELARISRFKSDFVANVSHELRTPLNSVIILSGLLARNREGNLSDEQVRYLGTIDRSARELLGLIDDILDLSRIEAGRLSLHFEDVRLESLAQIWEDYAEAQASRTGVPFTLEIDDDAPPSLFTDEMRLGQVVRNFLANAFKFSSKGGSVTLSVKRVRPGPRGEAGSPWPALEFSVRDSGPGIPRDKLATIFEAFNQVDTRVSRQFGGAGLGLAIASNLSRLLGGEIRVETQEGQGSTFRLVVPIRRIPRVLVVEDVEEQWFALRQGLLRAGLLPVHAPDAKTAFETLEAQEISVVVLDLRLPDVSGDQLLRELQIRSTLKKVPPVIVHTAVPLEANEKDQLLARVAALVSKDATSSSRVCELASNLVAKEELSRTLPRPQGAATSFETTGTVRTGGVSGLALTPPDGPSPVRMTETPRALDRGVEPERPSERSTVRPLERALERAGATSGPPEARTVIGAPIGKSPFEGMRALVVDDDERNVFSLREFLLSEGFEVEGAFTGREALARLQDGPRFNVALCDLMMPGLDGYETIRAIRALPIGASLAVVAVSAKAMAGEEERVKEAGATAFVPKPVNVDSLREVLSRLLRPRKATRALVVDDDPHVGAFVQILAGRAGAEAIHIQSAREALDLLSAGSREMFDVVISDLNMPEMDGSALLRGVRARGLRVPLFALTAETDPAIHARLRSEGFARILTKPLSAGDLEKAFGSLHPSAGPGPAGVAVFAQDR